MFKSKKEGDAVGLMNKGVAHADQGDYKRAIDEYNQALRIEPDLIPAYYNRGIAYLRTREYERAIQDLTRVIESDSPMADGAYFNRGTVYFETGEFEAAIADFTRAIEARPTNPELYRVYALRGTAYANKGMFKQALADLTKGIELNRYSEGRLAHGHYNRAGVYLRMDRYEDAAQDFRTVLTLTADQQLIDEAKKHLRQLKAGGFIR
jgi:tetratricopeptide (TPR) repeat protein